MESKTDILNDLTSIKDMMQKSSRFISLSGLSGVMAGIYALFGAYLVQGILSVGPKGNYSTNIIYTDMATVKLFILGVTLIILAFATGIILTAIRAKKQGRSLWDYQAKRLIINLLIPLTAGGLFCVLLLFQNAAHLIAPSTLIFYGLSLINASKYTLSTIRYLGVIEIILGLLAMTFLHFGLLFWTLGFGIMHIIYGLFMYFKYERKQ